MAVFECSHDFIYCCASPTRLGSLVPTPSKFTLFFLQFILLTLCGHKFLTHCLFLSNFPSHSQPFHGGDFHHTAFSVKKISAISAIVSRLMLLQFHKQGIIIIGQYALSLLNIEQRRLYNLPWFTQQITGRN